MFGSKAKRIKELIESNAAYYKCWRDSNDDRNTAIQERVVAQTQVTNLTAQLATYEEANQASNEDNRDLRIRLELLQDVLKQLRIPIRLKK
jgi:hypothetical protein